MHQKITDIKLLHVKTDTKRSAVIHLHKLRPLGSVVPG